MEAVVERMFGRCIADFQTEQALGVALDARRLDMVVKAIEHAADPAAALQYALKVCQGLLTSVKYRREVLETLVGLMEAAPQPDHVAICQARMFLEDAPALADRLHRLVASGSGSPDDALVAYQVAFDLFEHSNQGLLEKVLAALDALVQDSAQAGPAEAAAPSNGTEAMETEDEPDAAAAPPAALDADGALADSPEGARVANLKGILRGDTPIQLVLEFLFNNNRADLQLLKNIKTAIESRTSVNHSAVVIANALMHAGTTVDTFLRENLEWLSWATNWAKFSATAGLGVIHRGHLSQGRALMAPYLPGAASSGSPYSEGGALYALGLIHADQGASVRPFLLEALRSAASAARDAEVVQHGACLGLGLASFGTNDAEVFDELKSVLYTDSAVAGEAAGLGLGLLGCGSNDGKTGEMLAYAHDTQHEKITRGLAIGCALNALGAEEGADALIEQMTLDQDPMVRYGGMYAVGLAYRGTARNAAVQRLLSHAVSDVSDDVRRAAVLNLGFLMYGRPEQLPKLVALLAESYNPHVRYGAALAVGIGCAGTGLKEAQALLDGLLSDAVDFVRQGAHIATALVLLQQPEARLGAYRKAIDRTIADKHEDVMCKMGAIYAAGILDAGGRNVNVRLRTGSGAPCPLALAGMALFTQYWYWFPLTHFLSLAFAPTCVIGLNADLDLPQFEFTSKAKPSTFAYPAPVTNSSASQVAKLPAAVLSITAKADKNKARKKKVEASKDASKEGEPQAKAEDVDMAEGAEAGDAPKPKEEVEAAAKAEPEPEPEPSSEQKENPSRVVPLQERCIRFDPAGRFVPVKPGACSGILVLKDTRPGEPVDLVATTAPASVAKPAGQAAEEEAEPAPPEPFEYTPEN